MSAACQSLPVPACSPLEGPFLAMQRLHRQPRHPLGFYVICLVVACERWAAYTLSALAVLMLSERYGYARADALRIAALVNAASYLGTLPGGLLADKVMGHRRALSISTVLLAFGYAALISSAQWALALSLALLVTGSALFKPSTQAVLSRLYESEDARLEAAQTWFYMAVNAGAAVGALLAGLVVRWGGWSAAFASATAAMLLARLLLSLNRGALVRKVTARPPSGVVTHHLTRRRRVVTIAALLLAMLVYTICFGQVDGSLLLWAQERTDRVVFGFEVPAACLLP